MLINSTIRTAKDSGIFRLFSVLPVHNKLVTDQYFTMTRTHS